MSKVSHNDFLVNPYIKEICTVINLISPYGQVYIWISPEKRIKAIFSLYKGNKIYCTKKQANKKMKHFSYV